LFAGVQLHLKHIKLAGFKSFAEPTQIPVPGNLVGIVGPNGCGKSNVIDAVRWVLGESQAKHLRGETLQDVIFGGTADRKAQGRASVELVFDNGDGRAPGQWSQYAEIAVRRVLARDGVSNYFINNVHVRRRDVQDIFMGTGLGPRAYAIIEQGMISRIVESKPEEIRIFLEEAAGISKYKDRRRETELRLNDTRGHLARTEDIRQELGRQIEKLQDQAEVARVYRQLKDELLLTQNLLLFSRKRDAEASRARSLRELEKSQIELDAEMAHLREAERLIEESRQAHYTQTDALNAAQGAVYQANSEVSRIENQLQAVRAEQRRVENEMASLRQEIAEDERQLEAERAALTQHEAELARAAELVRVGTARLRQEKDAMPSAETLVAARRRALDEKRQAQAAQDSRISATRSELGAAQRLLSQIQERRTRLENERAQWVVPDADKLGSLAQKLRDQEVACTILAASRDALVNRVSRCESAFNGARLQADAVRGELTRIEAELTALEALQAKLAINERAQNLVHKHGLADLPVFWHGIEVKHGWELAVEAALGVRLNAYRMDGFDAVANWRATDVPGGIALYSPSQDSGLSSTAGEQYQVPGNPQALRDFVNARAVACQPALDHWLRGVFVMDRLSSALAASRQLPQGVSLVTPEGHLITRDSVVFFSPQGEFHGALTRAREIEERRLTQQELSHRCAVLEEQLAQAREAFDQCRLQQKEADSRAREAEVARHALDVERTRLLGQQERHLQRSQQWGIEWQELERQQDQERKVLEEAQTALETALASQKAIAAEVISHDQAWREADQSREVQRTALQSADRALQEAVFLEKTAQERIQRIRNTLQSAQQRLSQRKPRLEALASQQDPSLEVSLSESLQKALSERMQREQSLSGARVSLDNAAAGLRELEERRLVTEQRLEPLRTRLGDLRLKEQEARLNLENAEQALQENHADQAKLAELMEKGMRSATLQGEINRLNQEIEALGAVNLAALAELEAARERKSWLDAQAADLEQAVATLEDAMRKIDRETRDQLKETFDRVNENFSSMFPTLFGGGHARIELTGDEILDAGVQIIAQPPGKKTTSIHLLSGGEKALTAISLVFSLFQLNPAPFCILDEVDAPLDDNNTERFVRLVRRMAGQTQFLFITHNKIAMEMAQQLVGITMAESGVSRMVAVDIDEAIRMTETVAA
jgi:chromosome segregation protein